MPNKQEGMVQCQIDKKFWKPSEVKPAALIREPIVEIIRSSYPDWSSKGYICINDLNSFREEYVKDVLARGRGEITRLEKDVVQGLKEHELLSRDINAEFDRKLSLGERAADRLAQYAGSWRFIGIFMGLLVVWIFINSIVL